MVTKECKISQVNYQSNLKPVKNDFRCCHKRSKIMTKAIKAQ